MSEPKSGVGIGIPVTLGNVSEVAAALAENKRIKEAFAKPFAESEIKLKPAMVKNNRCLALHYIDARLVMDRLDEVVEPWGWRDEYTVLPSGEVECRLSVKFGDTWITKADVGGQSEQPDDGDKMKAAYSDALKRAAVKFGIGRHLYRMGNTWMDYDPVKKQIVKPAPRGAELPPAKPAQQRQPEPEPAKAAPALPATGQELHRRLQDYDAKLAAQKLCVRGALLAHVVSAGVKAGYTANMAEWTGPAIPFAVDVVREFEQTVRTPQAKA